MIASTSGAACGERHLPSPFYLHARVRLRGPATAPETVELPELLPEVLPIAIIADDMTAHALLLRRAPGLATNAKWIPNPCRRDARPIQPPPAAGSTVTTHPDQTLIIWSSGPNWHLRTRAHRPDVYFDTYQFEADRDTLRAVAAGLVPLIPPDTDRADLEP